MNILDHEKHEINKKNGLYVVIMWFWNYSVSILYFCFHSL